MSLRLLVAAALLAFAAGAAHAQEAPPMDAGAELFRLPEIEAEELPSPPGTEAEAEAQADAAPSPSDAPTGDAPVTPESVLADSILGDSVMAGWVPGGEYLRKSYWDPWEGNVELGLNGTEGNSQTFNVRFGMTAKHKTDWLEKTMQVTSIQKSANGVTTANTALLDGRLDWPMKGSNWNYFVHGLLEYDEFKAFDARVSGDTGFGYEFIQNDATKLIGRTGLAFSQEIGGPQDDFVPELLFGGEFKHKFNDSNTISFQSNMYPAIEDFSDYRLNSQASWELALSKLWGLSLKFSLIDRYDSTPLGKKPNDLDYSTLLLWNF